MDQTQHKARAGRQAVILAGVALGAAILIHALASPLSDAQAAMAPAQELAGTSIGEFHSVPLSADQTALAALLRQTSPYAAPAQRDAALPKVQAHPDLAGALAQLLQSEARDGALIYLEGNEPMEGKALADAARLAEPVRVAILGEAQSLRERMRTASDLRADHFVPQVRRVLAVADRFAPYGVDYVPAVRAVAQALDEPHPQGERLRCRRVLQRWLAKHAR